MALTGKTALLTCLSFIFSMSWLVSNVARPIIEQRPPLIARGAEARVTAEQIAASNPEPKAITATTADPLRNRFQVASTLADANRPRQIAEETLVMTEHSISGFERELPPMYVPSAPIVVQLEPPTGVGEEERPVNSDDEAARYAAAIDEDAIPGSRSMPIAMLAALRPEEDTGVGRGWEISQSKQSATPRTYTVQAGDTLNKIVKRLWQRSDPEAVRILLVANPDLARRKDRIFVGEVLKVPDPDALEQPVALVRAQPPASKDSGEKAKAASPDKKEVRYNWYTVKEKDSLVVIARRYLKDPNRWREIAELNQLRDADRIVPGSRIKLPMPRMDT